MATNKQSPSAERLQKLLSGKNGVPTSALKELRGSRTKQDIATASGISRPHYSLVEDGVNPLTDQTAAKLAGPLGLPAGELQIAESLASVKRRALKGSLEPHSLLALIEELSAQLPETALGERVLDSMVAILAEALEQYKGENPISFSTKSKPRAALKEAAHEPARRDDSGIRKDKPNQPAMGR